MRLAVSIGSLFLVCFFLRDKLGETRTIFQHDFQWTWFGVAAAIYLIALGILAVRLLFIFRVQHIRMNYGEVFYLGFVGLFFNLFFPSAVGGDVAKAFYAYKHSGKKIESTTSVILDRLMGFASLILMALAAVLIYQADLNDARINNLVYVALAVLLLTVAFFASKRFASRFKFLSVLVPSSKWRARISDVYHAIYNYKHHRRIMVLAIALSFLGQVLFIILHYFLVLSLGFNLTPWIFFIFIPIVSIVSMAPSLGGLGVREASAIYLFSRFMTTERAFALSLLMDALIYGYSFIGGVLYALKGGLKSKLVEQMEELK